ATPAVTAAAPTAPRKRVVVPPASAVRRNAPTPDAPANRPLVTITAAADVPSFGTGQALTASDLPKAMYERAKNLADRSGRVSVATIERAGVQYVGENQDPTELLDSLVASLLEPKTAGQTRAA